MIANHSLSFDVYPSFRGGALSPYRLLEDEFKDEWEYFNFKGRGMRIPKNLSDFEIKLIKFLFNYSGKGRDSIISCPMRVATLDKSFMVEFAILNNIREYAAFMMRYKFANVVFFDKDNYDASGTSDERDLRKVRLYEDNKKINGDKMPLILCINTIGFSDEQYRAIAHDIDFVRFKNQTYLLVE